MKFDLLDKIMAGAIVVLLTLALYFGFTNKVNPPVTAIHPQVVHHNYVELKYENNGKVNYWEKYGNYYTIYDSTFQNEDLVKDMQSR